MSVLVTSLRRGGQPSHGVRFNPKWIRRGLVAVYDRGLFHHVNGQVSAGTTTGGPKRMGGPLGVVDGFGSTFGTGTTDRRGSVGTLRTPPGARSIVAFVYAKSTGGGAFGRVFQHSSGIGYDAGDEGMWMNGGYLVYNRLNSTDAIQWRGSTTLPLNTWACVGVTSDQSSYQTLPSFYFNGRSDGGAEVTAYGSAPYSSRNTTVDIGNRASDSTRGWDGMLGPILFFDSLLTAQEHFDLYANPFQVYAERYWDTYFDSALPAGGPVDGALSVTQGANSLTAEGLLGGAVEGALSVTQGANTVTAVGHGIGILNTADRGTIDLANSSVTPNGTTPTISVKNRWFADNSSGARATFFHVTGVNGMTPVFEVDRSNMENNNATQKFLWSYTGALGSWQEFTTTTRVTSPNVYRSSNGSAFTQDTVYVSMQYPWRIGDTLTWIQSLESSGYVSYAPSGGTSYQFETRSATTNGSTAGAGDVIPAQPLYSFKISNGSSIAPDGEAKRKMVLVAGMHAAEDVGNYVLKGAAEFLASSDTQAVLTRAWFDIYVYPVVASAGRAGGATRNDFENLYKTEDVNRAWDDSPVLETITKHKAAILADAGSTIDVFFDFHGDIYTSTYYDYFSSSLAKQSVWQTAIQQYIPGHAVNSLDIFGSAGVWAYASKGATFSVTPEHAYGVTLNLANVEAFGANHVKAVAYLITQGEWGYPEGALSVTQAANTVSATGALAIQGVLDAAQAGNTVSATGGETPGVVGAAEVAQDGNSVSAAGAVEIAGALEVAQAGNMVASTGGGSTTLTAADLAAIAALVQSIVDAGVNVSKLNGATLYGSGTIGDKWRGTA